MKFLLMFLCFCGLSFFSYAQIENIGDYEIKVVSYRYKTTKGKLKKVTPEGMGIEDYKGNYIIFRTPDIVRVKVRRRGLTVGKAASVGTLLGLGIGGGLWSLDESGENTADLAKLTLVLTASGAVIGTAVGGVAELSNQKLTLNVNGSEEYFKKNYQRLEKYVDTTPEMQHVSN